MQETSCHPNQVTLCPVNNSPSSSHDDLLFFSILLTCFHALMQLGELAWPGKKSLQDYHIISMQNSVQVLPEAFLFFLPGQKADRFFYGNCIVVVKNAILPLHVLPEFSWSHLSQTPWSLAATVWYHTYLMLVHMLPSPALPLWYLRIQCMLIVPLHLWKLGAPLHHPSNWPLGIWCLPNLHPFSSLQLFFTAVPPLLVDCILFDPIIPQFLVLSSFLFLVSQFSPFLIVHPPTFLPYKLIQFCLCFHSVCSVLLSLMDFYSAYLKIHCFSRPSLGGAMIHLSSTWLSQPSQSGN